MKSLNAKRIAALGASLLMGLAVAGQGVSFGNVPIVNNQGQPVVQIVVGHAAQPSDGVVAANIAAVIGNMALTTVNVSATVTGGGGRAVSCVVTTPSCTLTNQQVWLGEKGLAAPSGSYAFTALIGSVLNRAVSLNEPAQTKALQTSASQYAFPETTSLTASPAASAFSASGSVPTSGSVVYNYNGGGVSFTGFAATGGGDNLLQVTTSSLPGLLSNYGGNGETESLWLSGFPVFDQASGTNNFAVVNAGGAYEATFSSPIQEYSSGGSRNINVPIKLLGQNWTILNETAPTATVASTNVTYGGKVTLAESLLPLTTVYVGHNVTNSSVGGFNVELTDLGQPNANGLSNAAVEVFYNGVLTNTTQLSPFSTQEFNVSGHTLFVRVNQTFAGLYAYQKWAKMQLFSNLFNLTNGKSFNQTRDPGWNVNLLWTNTSSGGGAAHALEGLVVWNASPVTLLPGQGFNFIENPKTWSVKFVGDTLGNNYDAVSAASSYTASVSGGYKNVLSAHTVSGLDITNVTEPAEELTVTSSIPNAFSYAGQTSSTVTYDLTPYALNENANAATVGNAVQMALSLTSNAANVNLWVNNTNQLQAQITGYQTSTSPSPISETVVFTAASNTQPLSTPLYNVTAIKLNRALPGAVNVIAEASNTANVLVPANVLANLVSTAPMILYSQTGTNYQLTWPSSYTPAATAASVNVIYNQQNGQPQSNFVLSSLGSAAPNPNTGAGEYYTYSFGEVAVPTNTQAVDQLGFGIFNSTGGPNTQPMFYLNYSTTGTHNNMTYTSTQNHAFNVGQGFRTERGSQIAKISPTTVTVNLAKSVDTLELLVGAASNSTSNVTTTSVYGPYGVGQQTNLANVTIANVSAKCTFTATSCNVTGLTNLTATPSVTKAVVSSHLDTATTPLAVLDTNANNASSLIVVGSAYVNSVAAQIFAQNPQLAQSFTSGGASGPNAVIVQAFSGANGGASRILVAGYTANQTVTAGNQFINDLLSAAGST